MSNILIYKESKEILRQMSTAEHSSVLLCPILKVLQMRHSDLDVSQATKVVREMLHD